MPHPLGLQLCVGWVHPQQQLPHSNFTPKMWERLVLARLQDGLPGFSQGGFGGWKLLGFPCGWRVGGQGRCAAEGRPAPTWVGWAWGSWSHGPWHRWLLGPGWPGSALFDEGPRKWGRFTSCFPSTEEHTEAERLARTKLQASLLPDLRASCNP